VEHQPAASPPEPAVAAGATSFKSLTKQLIASRQLRVTVTKTIEGTGAVGGEMFFLTVSDGATCGTLRTE
jgi:hypothetical protein